MKKLGKIAAKKSLGQHFLVGEAVPRLMADAADVRSGDTVLEIGPGTGVLTRELLARGARVIAVEADVRALEALDAAFGSEIARGQLAVAHGDARELDAQALGLTPGRYKVVSNIPYYLTGLLLRRLLETDVQPSAIVFLVQREVAERIARDKKESLLSLSVKVFGVPKYVKTVGRGTFSPPPNVDSAIVAISGISKKRLKNVPEQLFFKVLHEGFKSKRKQLIGNLTGILGRDSLTHIFSTLGIKSTVRGEDLPLDTWLDLCTEISLHK